MRRYSSSSSVISKSSEIEVSSFSESAGFALLRWGLDIIWWDTRWYSEGWTLIVTKNLTSCLLACFVASTKRFDLRLGLCSIDCARATFQVSERFNYQPNFDYKQGFYTWDCTVFLLKPYSRCWVGIFLASLAMKNFPHFIYLFNPVKSYFKPIWEYAHVMKPWLEITSSWLHHPKCMIILLLSKYTSSSIKCSCKCLKASCFFFISILPPSLRCIDELGKVISCIWIN